MGTGNDHTSLAVGVSLCTLAALFSVIGVNLQKKAHIANEELPPSLQTAYYRLPLWWIGLGGVVMGALCDFVSLAFAPQSIVAAFGASTLVFNTWTAPFFLNETLGSMEVAATCVIAGGAALVVSLSSASTTNVLIADVLFTSKFGVYMSCVAIVCGGLLMASVPQPGIAGIHDSASLGFRGVCKCGVSGILGAQSLLFAKSVMLSIREAIEGVHPSPFAKGQTYLIVLMTVGFILSQTHTLNAALAEFDAVFVLPIFQVCWIVGGVVGAGVVYDEFSDLPTTHILAMNCGFVVIATGIYKLTVLHAARSTPGPIDHRNESMSPNTNSAGRLARFAGGLMAHHGLQVNEGHWLQVYTTTRRVQPNVIKSADAGAISRLFRNAGIEHPDRNSHSSSFGYWHPSRARLEEASAGAARQARAIREEEDGEDEEEEEQQHEVGDQEAGQSPGQSLIGKRAVRSDV